jgi:hypothetical protein
LVKVTNPSKLVQTKGVVKLTVWVPLKVASLTVYLLAQYFTFAVFAVEGMEKVVLQPLVIVPKLADVKSKLLPAGEVGVVLEAVV